MIADKCIMWGSDRDSDNKGGKGLKNDGWASLSKRHVNRDLDYTRECARPCARGWKDKDMKHAPCSHQHGETYLLGNNYCTHFHFSFSCIGEGNGNPLQCSCLENPRDGEAWWAAVYGVAQSRTGLKWLSSSSSSSVRKLQLTRPLEESHSSTLLPCYFRYFCVPCYIVNLSRKEWQIVHLGVRQSARGAWCLPGPADW